MPRLLTFERLADYGVLTGRRNLDRLEIEGLFPKRVLVSKRAIAWVESEIIAHVAAQIKGRSQEIGRLGTAGVMPRKSARAKKRRAK